MPLTNRQLKELRCSDSNPNRLRKAMELSGLTHSQVAEGVDAAQPHITEIANGNYSRLPLETARTLATFFGCSIEDLFPARDAVAS